MRITYDKKADAMYIYMNPRKKVTETREMANGWIIDYADKDIVGIEILSASKVLGAKLGINVPPQSVSFAHKIR